jgi:UDP-N-acetylmuramate dehydrogenase
VTPELEAVAAALGARAQLAHPLGALSTYRVGGPAAVFVEAGDEEDLIAVREALSGRDVALLVLGKGSNLLVADAGFEGVVVHLSGGFAWFDHLGEVDGTERVRAGAALELPVLARRCVALGLRGMEWAVGVPGSASLVTYRWLDLASGREGIDGVEHLGYGYRRSSVAQSEVVSWAEFALGRGDEAAGREELRSIVRWRREHQPGGSNAGSVFTNPPGDSAGRLIDEAGLRGYRLGTAQVSEKHANFIQADDGGSADDVDRLMDQVRSVVAERTGVELVAEVRRIGFTRTGEPR